jgi:hypothetical protein
LQRFARGEEAARYAENFIRRLHGSDVRVKRTKSKPATEDPKPPLRAATSERLLDTAVKLFWRNGYQSKKEDMRRGRTTHVSLF